MVNPQAKPEERWLTPVEFAEAIGVAPRTVYTYIAIGEIPAEHVKPAGKFRLLINANALTECEAKWRRNRNI